MNPGKRNGQCDQISIFDDTDQVHDWQCLSDAKK